METVRYLRKAMVVSLTRQGNSCNRFHYVQLSWPAKCILRKEQKVTLQSVWCKYAGRMVKLS